MIEKTDNGLWRVTMDSPWGKIHVVADTPQMAMIRARRQIDDMGAT